MLNIKLFTAAVVAWALLGPTPGLAANCKQDPDQPKCQDSTFTTMAFWTLPPTVISALPDLMITDIEDPNDPSRDPDDQHVCPPEVTIEIDGTGGSVPASATVSRISQSWPPMEASLSWLPGR